MTQHVMVKQAGSIGIADGGIETALVERLGQELPEFAAFVLLETESGRAALHDYFRPFIDTAMTQALPIVLDTPTWRANSDWGARLGFDAAALAALNTDAVAVVRSAIDASVVDEAVAPEITVNGCVGPRYDDYVAAERMTVAEAEQYHAPQVIALAEAGADRVTAVTTLDAAEGIGVVRAAVAARIPVAVSFVVGADGRLADGSSIAEAIAEVDAATDGAALGFLVNCAHPAEVASGLNVDAPGNDTEVALARIVGFRLNAAKHGEDGPGDDPAEFAVAELALATHAPHAAVFGGCCGTDVAHISALAQRVQAIAGSGILDEAAGAKR